MSNVICKGILNGRAYGGIGCLINTKKHANKVKFVAKDDRYLALTFYDNLVVNIYLPVNKDPNSYNCNVIDMLTRIGNLIKSHTKHNIVIGVDFNFDFAFNHPGCILFKEFMRDYKLKCCDALIDSIDSNMFTYCHASLNSHSFIDHFFGRLCFLLCVVNCSIDDSGSNLSDHSAVLLKLK